MAQRGCEVAARCHHARVVIRLNDKDEIEVGVLVYFSLAERAAHKKSDEARIGFEDRDDLVGKVFERCTRRSSS